MSDELKIVGTIVGLFLLGLVMVNPAFIGLPSYPNSSNSTIQSNTGQLVVQERAPVELRERSNFENSATNDDRPGNIILTSNTPKRISSNNVGLSASVNNTRFARSASQTNYGMLLLVIIMLAVIVVLVRITSRKQSRVDRRRYTQAYPQIKPISQQQRRVPYTHSQQHAYYR